MKMNSHFRDSHAKLHNNNTSSSDKEAKRNNLSLRKSKDKNEDVEEESPVTPDSTTEPPRPAHDFQEGEDVFFCTEEGQNMLGNIGQVTQFRCQILFGDGTQQWAPLKRIKKLSCSFNEEGPSPPSRSADESSSRTTTRDQLKTDMICIVCKSVKKMSSKKARLYTNLPFKCNRCSATKIDSNSTSLNITNNNHHTPSAAFQKKTTLSQQLIKRLRTSDNPSPPQQQGKSSTSNSLNHLAMNLQKGDISIRPIHNVTSASQYLQQTTSMSSLTHRQSSPVINPMLIPVPHRPQPTTPINSRSTSASTVSLTPNSTQNHITQHQLRVGPGPLQMPSPPKNTRTNLCFHCGQRTCPYDRVHCNMCERYCHLLCLSLTPPPLEGDKFWDVMCSACGTQNESEKGGSKVFSVRRSISSWSDVVHLIINCLKVKSLGQQYFDFDNQIMPFFDNNIDKLHLPRLYKVVSREERKTNLLNALTNSRFRFSKHKTELKKTGSSWALRSDHASSSKLTKSDFQDVTATTSTTTLSKSGSDKDNVLNKGQLRSPKPHSSTSNNKNLPSKYPEIDSSSSARTSYLQLSQTPTTDQSFHREKAPSTDTSPHLNSTMSVKFKNNSSYSPSPHTSSTFLPSSQNSQNKNVSISPRTTTTPIPVPSSSPNMNNNIATSFPRVSTTSSPLSPRVLSKEILLRNPITTNIILSPTKASMQGQGNQNKNTSLTTSDCDKRTQGKDTTKDKTMDHTTTKLKGAPRKVGRPSKRDNPDKFKPKSHGKSSSETSVVNVHRQRLRIRLKPPAPGENNNSQKDSSDGTVAVTDSAKKKQQATSSTPSSTSSIVTIPLPRPLPCSPMQLEQPKSMPLPTSASSSPVKEIRSRKRAYIADTINTSQNQNNISLNTGVHSIEGILNDSGGAITGKMINPPNGLVKTMAISKSTTKLGQMTNVGKTRKLFSYQMSQQQLQNSYDASVVENENELDECAKDLSIFQSNLMEACMYGGLKTQCLPHLPKTKAEVEKKIGEYLTAEADDSCNTLNNEIGSDGGSSVKRLFCNWPSRHNYRHNYPPNNFYGFDGDTSNNNNGVNFGTPTKRVGGNGTTSSIKSKEGTGKKSVRNLEDVDAYDILAMRVGEDGVVRYEIVWLDEVPFDSEEEELDCEDSKPNIKQDAEGFETIMEVDEETTTAGTMNGNGVNKDPIELQVSSNCTEINIKKEKEASSTSEVAGNAAIVKNGHRRSSVTSSSPQQQASKRDPVFIDLTDSP